MARSHRAKTGDWPTRRSGFLEGVPGETWRNINNALIAGHRGLPGGDTLVRLPGAEGWAWPNAAGRPRKQDPVEPAAEKPARKLRKRKDR